MHSLLLFDVNEQPISVEALERIFKSVAGFGEVRFNTPASTPIEASYENEEDFTIVYLNSERKTISIRGTSGAALRAAFILQSNLENPLRMVDTDYSFDLILRDFATLEDLEAAIDRAQAS